MYALGITFYHLITHEYPVFQPSFQWQKKIMCQLKCIKRPRQVTDDQLWNLLSRLLEFDPNKRITAAEALQHPYFTSPEAVADISKEQQDLASIAKEAQLNGDETISEFDINPTYIVAESELRQIQFQQTSNKTQSSFFKESEDNKPEISLHLLDSQIDQSQSLSCQMDKEKEDKNMINNTQQFEYDQEIYPQKPYSVSQSLQSTPSQTFKQSSSQEIVPQSSSQSSNKVNYQLQIYSMTSDELIYYENKFLKMIMTIEQIKINLENFEKLSLFDRDVTCVNLSNHLKQNHTSRDIVLEEGGIIDILNDVLINRLPVQQMYPIYYYPILTLLINNSDEQRKKINQKGVNGWIKRLLINYDEIYILNLTNFFRIITKKLRKLDLQQQQNPLLYELKKNETVGMLFEIFNTKTLPEDKTKRCCIAIIIGYLFKSAPLPTEFTQNVINFLKNQLLNSVYVLQSNSLNAISSLAECQENHKYILNNEFIKEIEINLHSEKNLLNLFNYLTTLLSLYNYGTNMTRIMIQREISVDIIKQLTHNQNIDIIIKSKELLKLFEQDQEPQFSQQFERERQYNENSNMKQTENIQYKEKERDIIDYEEQQQEQDVRKECNNEDDEQKDNENQQNEEKKNIQVKDQQQEQGEDQEQEQSNKDESK